MIIDPHNIDKFEPEIELKVQTECEKEFDI